MKAKFFSAMIAPVILLASCTKNPDPVDPVSSNGQVASTVDGKQFKSTSSTGTVNMNNETFLITATDKDDNSIMIAGPAKTGTFTNDSNHDLLGTYTNTNGELWMTSFGGNFNLTITKFDKVSKKMSGSFSFTAEAVGTSNATGTKTVTNGSFTDVSVIL